MRKYVTYMRVSTAEQGRSGLGLDAQKRDISIFLETFSDVAYEIVGSFVEVQSGKDDQRPELAKAIHLAKSTGAELLIAKLDRLSRRVSFISSLMEDAKLSIRVAQMPYADKFQLHIYAALAEQERDFISRRTKAALREAKAKGVTLGGLRDKTMVRNAAIKAQALARAQRLEEFLKPMRDSGYSLRKIASELNKVGLKSAQGGEWSASQVKRTLDRLDERLV